MRLFLLALILSGNLIAQDSLYTRQILKTLTSKHFFGRGYTKSGMTKAADFIEREMRKANAKALFGNSYKQAYYHPVNIFTGKTSVKLNDNKLKPGVDYILNPASTSIKGDFELKKKDSIHFVAQNSSIPLHVILTNKLTFGVSTERSKSCEVILLKSSIKETPSTINLSINTKLNPEFQAENIGCSIDGENNDSCIVFTAHYDHLGSMGKDCYFPGANDNASGTSMLLNLMNYYQKNKPKYKTVFVFFASEEAGLIGSKYFSENCPFPLSQIKFLINLDLLGTGDEGIMVVNGTILDGAFKLLQDINAEEKLLPDIRKRGKAMNSDHYWFTEKGVPSFFIYTLGGIKAYHDIYDIEPTLPLTAYKNIFRLLTQFSARI